MRRPNDPARRRLTRLAASGMLLQGAAAWASDPAVPPLGLPTAAAFQRPAPPPIPPADRPSDPSTKAPAAPEVPGPPPVAAPGALPKPAYAQNEPLPIDLPSVLRLVGENSPVIGFAQARVAAAQARLDRAELAWLPNLQVGVQYNRFDGQTQNQRGEVFGVSRSNLFAGGGPSLRVDSSDAIFGRLIARRLTAAEQASVAQTTLTAQLDAALAYFDLVEVYGRLAVNADTLDKAETMLRFARNAQTAALSKTAADVNRAETEVFFRRQERTDLQGRAGAASARLARLLLLQPSLDLRPAESAVAPVTLVNDTCTLDDLVAAAVAGRPELAAFRELAAAAATGIRQARTAPLLPSVVLEQQTGTFGGGQNAFVGNFDSRSVLGVGAVWEFQNLGFGDAARVRERRAEYQQAVFRLTDVQARVSGEVVEAAKVGAAKVEQLDAARQAVAQASETYRKLRETSFNMVGPRAQYDALEPLTAIQQLNQARGQYLAAVVDYNRAQVRLHAAIGRPVAGALVPAGSHTPAANAENNRSGTGHVQTP